ncbi:unnamed protein product [Linum trigynum]|uniref:Uncharacterized protein n=1 Tax=Linum trigynum TaxID=586398 RepID=A0AAV2DEG7_9ROSI
MLGIVQNANDAIECPYGRQVLEILWIDAKRSTLRPKGGWTAQSLMLQPRYGVVNHIEVKQDNRRSGWTAQLSNKQEESDQYRRLEIQKITDLWRPGGKRVDNS